jgi:hypothetical protein
MGRILGDGALRQYISKLWKSHRTALAAFAAVVLIYVIMSAVGIGCPIKYITGISCPGCGMTRAYLSVLRLDMMSAFEYHPLWFCVPVVAFLLLLFKLKGRKREFWAVVCIAVCLMIGVYIYRMIFTDSDIVIFSPTSGAVYRLIQRVMGL